MSGHGGFAVSLTAVDEAGDLAGTFVQKSQRCAVLAPFQLGAGVAFGLCLVGGRVLTGFVAPGPDHANRPAPDKQSVARRPVSAGYLCVATSLAAPSLSRFVFRAVHRLLPACRRSPRGLSPPGSSIPQAGMPPARVKCWLTDCEKVRHRGPFAANGSLAWPQLPSCPFSTLRCTGFVDVWRLNGGNDEETPDKWGFLVFTALLA